MRVEVEGKRANVVFDSMADMVEAVQDRQDIIDFRNNQMKRDGGKFYGARSMEKLFPLALNGMPGDGVEAMDIANQKVATIEREIDMPAFFSYYDVSGADVDVARYLSGEPENMINYHMVDTPRAGRIISLVISVTTAGSTEVEAIRQRGLQVVALVFAIEKIGFQVELWADFLIRENSPYGNEGPTDTEYTARVRTKIKSPGEMLDPGQVVFAFTHPGFLRGLGFAAMHMIPKEWHSPLNIGHGYGCVCWGKDDLREYAEGSVFLPSFRGRAGDLDTLVTDKLRELGIV
jgi:hypothetical protein